MRDIVFQNEHRRKHFEFFRSMNHPHFSICGHLDVGPWVRETRSREIRLTSGLVYLLSRAANAVPELRQRIRADRVVEHDVVHPSFAVTTETTDVFSFCEVKFGTDFTPFIQRADREIAKMRSEPVFEDAEGRDDYLFMSVIPWIHFTSVTHPMHYHPHDSVPRITWGQLRRSGGELLMPLSVQAHHALMDGVHMGRFFQLVEELAQDPAASMSSAG